MAVSLVAGDDSNAEHMAIENNHPDIMIIEPEVSKKSKTNFQVIKIETIRAVNHSLKISPIMSDKKVLIINNAHMMNASAANSLLRILEEHLRIDIYF